MGNLLRVASRAGGIERYGPKPADERYLADHVTSFKQCGAAYIWTHYVLS